MLKVMCDIVNLDRRLCENGKSIARLSQLAQTQKMHSTITSFVKGALLHDYKFGSHSYCPIFLLLIVFLSLSTTLALLLSEAVSRLHHICSLSIISDFFL